MRCRVLQRRGADLGRVEALGGVTAITARPVVVDDLVVDSDALTFIRVLLP
jgi:hypothetical protein